MITSGNSSPDCCSGRDDGVRELLFLLTAAVLHELGHIFCALVLRIPLAGLTFRPCGAVMTFDFSGTTYFRELCVHLAGAGTGILTAGTALRMFGEPAAYFAGVSIVLAVLNLLPIEGFDGGGALVCLCSMVCSPERTERICRVTSRMVLLLLWAAVLWLELRVQRGSALLLYVLYLMIFYTGIVRFG